MIELLKLIAYAMGALWVLVMLSMAMSLARRRREVRRMHQARTDFGLLGGQRFTRCTTCGHVRHD